MKHTFHYLKNTMDFGLCFKIYIKVDIMCKVHSNEVVDHSRGQTCFKRNVNHNQGFERNMRGQVHFDENVIHSQGSKGNMKGKAYSNKNVRHIQGFEMNMKG
jgi:hypothetical protein